jgi:hypothetical protein
MLVNEPSSLQLSQLHYIWQHVIDCDIPAAKTIVNR